MGDCYHYVLKKPNKWGVTDILVSFWYGFNVDFNEYWGGSKKLDIKLTTAQVDKLIKGLYCIERIRG